MSEWISNNVENPYPNREEKNLLALKTGLNPLQVSNWFSNWRKRKWEKNNNQDPSIKSDDNIYNNNNTNKNNNHNNHILHFKRDNNIDSHNHNLIIKKSDDNNNTNLPNPNNNPHFKEEMCRKKNSITSDNNLIDNQLLFGSNQEMFFMDQNDNYNPFSIQKNSQEEEDLLSDLLSEN